MKLEHGCTSSCQNSKYGKTSLSKCMQDHQSAQYNTAHCKLSNRMCNTCAHPNREPNNTAKNCTWQFFKTNVQQNATIKAHVLTHQTMAPNNTAKHSKTQHTTGYKIPCRAHVYTKQVQRMSTPSKNDCVKLLIHTQTRPSKT